MGFFSDLVGSFTGSSARKDLQAGAAASNAALSQGEAQLRDQYGQAIQGYQPYAQYGQQQIGRASADQDLYRKMLMGDADALGTLTNNPLFNGELGASQMAAQRAGNAAGWGAGKEALAGQRVFQQNAGSYLDRYRDNAMQGQQGVALGLQAQNAMGNAQMGLGDSSWNMAATRAGKATTDANAMAGTRSILSNNLLQLGGLAVNAMKPTPKLG